MFGADHVLAPLGPEHHHAAHHQGGSHGDRIEQVVVDHIGERHAKDHRREEGDQQVGGETLRRPLGGQTTHDLEDLPAEFPDHRQDGGQLDDDIERLGTLADEAEQVGNDDLVPGTGHRQKLGKSLYHPQHECLEGTPQLRTAPPRGQFRLVE
ncbi:hypothetical protein D3C80_1421110 [compost metagenome]